MSNEARNGSAIVAMGYVKGFIDGIRYQQSPTVTWLMDEAGSVGSIRVAE
jgi:hypothetical protein